MTTAADRILVDTCVLLEAVDTARPQHEAALGFLNRRENLVCCAQVIREFLVVATRPVVVNGLGMPLVDALANLEELRRVMRLLPEEKPILPKLLMLLAKCPCTGKRIHDANLVATVLTHGVGRIATFNVQDFEGFSDIIAVGLPANLYDNRSQGD